MDWFLYDSGLRHERVKWCDYFNPVQDWLFGLSIDEDQKLPFTQNPYNKCACLTIMKFCSYILAKEDPKNINHVTHPLTSANFSIFYQKLAIYVILGNKGKSCIKQFVILLTFEVFIINVVPVLMTSALLATPGLFEVTLY